MLKEGRYTVELPVNGINSVGVDAIKRWMMRNGLPPLPADWAWTWQVSGKGPYVGSFTKRFQKFMHKNDFDVTSQDVSCLGNLVSDHCDKEPQQYWFELTQDLMWERGMFADPDSCFWTCRAKARYNMQDAGVWAMKFYDGNGYRPYLEGIARAWLVDHAADSSVPEGCVCVFNGYGLTSQRVARVLSRHLGDAYYKSVELFNNDKEDGLLWINDSGGYLVGDGRKVRHQNDVRMSIGTEDWGTRCVNCGAYLPDGGCELHNGEKVCDTCAVNDCFQCRSCDKLSLRGCSSRCLKGRRVCRTCYDKVKYRCFTCGGEHDRGTEVISNADGEARCKLCHWKAVFKCVCCGGYHVYPYFTASGYVCSGCRHRKCMYCDICRQYVIGMTTCFEGNYYCTKCEGERT